MVCPTRDSSTNENVNDDTWGTPDINAHWDDSPVQPPHQCQYNTHQQQEDAHAGSDTYTKTYHRSPIIIITGNRNNYRYITGVEGIALQNLEKMYGVHIIVPQKHEMYNSIIICYDEHNKRLAENCAAYIVDVISQ